MHTDNEQTGAPLCSEHTGAAPTLPAASRQAGQIARTASVFVDLVDATIGDAAELVALDERNFARSDRFDRRLWRTILSGRTARNQLLTRIARAHGTTIGAIVGEFRPKEGRLVVWSIAVDEPHRGSGLAERLLADLIERTPAAYGLVSLDARRDNARARRFYVRLGFREVNVIRGGYADGTDAIRYETSLAALQRALARAGPAEPDPPA